MTSSISNSPSQNAAVPGELSGYQQWTSSLAGLLEAARQELEHDKCAARALIVRAAAMLRPGMDEARDPGGIGPSGLAGWQRQRVRAYIDENLDQRIQVRGLSKIVRRSPAHFSRAFKRSFGATPHAYIVRRRLERAIHLILHSDASLSEIALTCGFTDQSHLSNLFRQHIGSSPASWRQSRREVSPGPATARDSSHVLPTVVKNGSLGGRP
jgi:AraC-like DNA-binding protein